jgi:hypothetical protein
MKKIVTLFLFSFLVLSGCSIGEDKNKEPLPPVNSSPCSVAGSDGTDCFLPDNGGKSTCPPNVLCNVLGPVAGKCQNGSCVAIDKEKDADKEEVNSSSSSSLIFENQYIKISIPYGWKLTEAKRIIKNQAYDKVSKKVVAAGDPVLEKTGAVNIVKDDYILYINPLAEQVSGVIGGRFGEIVSGAPSADAVITDGAKGACSQGEISPVSDKFSRVDFYIKDEGQKEKYPWCVFPGNDLAVWYFSYITDSRGGYFNYYKQGAEPGPFGLVITMAYNSDNVNKLPAWNSADLEKKLKEMSGMIRTLEIKDKEISAKLTTPAEKLPTEKEDDKLKNTEEQKNNESIKIEEQKDEKLINTEKYMPVESKCDSCLPYESTNKQGNSWCKIGEEIKVYHNCMSPDKLVVKGLTWITMPDGGQGQYCVAEKVVDYYSETFTEKIRTFSINRVYFKEDKTGYDCDIMFQPHQRLDCFNEIKLEAWPCTF